MSDRSVRVFISYSHDSPKHRDNVLKLCNDLRGRGVDAWIDRYESPPAQGWPLWMQEQIEAADFVLIVITATWTQRAKGKAPKNVGLGARWEGRLIAQRSYESDTLDKLIPVFWGAGQKEYIPPFLRSTSFYDLESAGAFEDLYRRLTNQPDVIPPPLGPMKNLRSAGAAGGGSVQPGPGAPADVAPSSSRGAAGIDVLVFTPLHEEREAFLRKLENVSPVGPTRTDVFSYHRGSLAHADGAYQIAVAMPLQMGTRDAATVAARAIDHWQPRYVLLVGIAGAVRRNGAQLGDVIIADSILDYELQKLKARKDEMRARFYPVDPGLLSAAQTLVGDDWSFGITAARPQPGTPAVHTGLVASGDKVFARSSALDNILKSYPKLLGVEMEAAGAARAAQQSAVPPRVFMVRSASDFADSKKDTGHTTSWREYACDVAASFAAALLRAGALIPAANGHSAPHSAPDPPAPLQVEVGPELRDRAKRKRLDFDDNAKRYGFWAERLQATKRIHPDGSSTLSYRVEGLNTKIPLRAFRFMYKSGTGIVGTPVPDEKTRLENIGWEPEAPPPSYPLELNVALESVCKAMGAFQFTRQPDDPALSWSWDMDVLNGDATTEWEFLHLYTKANRKHFDKNDLRSAMEYFARVVWMPAKEFVSIVELPASIASVPRLSVFNAGVTQPAVREVVNDQVVLTYPPANAEWWRDAKMESLEAPSLKRDGRTWTVRIEYPPMGYAYSIDWALPKTPLSDEADRVVRKAEAIRTELLRYRKERRNGEPSTPAFQQIAQAFSSLDNDLRREFQPRADREMFDLFFMTYFREELALKIVDGFKNGKRIEDSDWEFSLPFGLGLAGAAFKAGKPFAYRRPLEQAEGPDYYIAVKGSSDHQVLIAVPLDHPDLDKCSKQCELRTGSRCQQLIGVVNIGSNYVDSNLLEIAPNVTTSDEVQVSEEAKKRIQALKARCKQFAMEVTAALAR